MKIIFISAMVVFCLAISIALMLLTLNILSRLGIRMFNKLCDTFGEEIVYRGSIIIANAVTFAVLYYECSRNKYLAIFMQIMLGSGIALFIIMLILDYLGIIKVLRDLMKL